MSFSKNDDIWNMINDKTLDALNCAADRIMEERFRIIIDHNLLKALLEGYLTLNRKVINSPSNIVANHITKEEMIKVMLDFFSSLDKDFYNQAVQVILGQNEKIKAHIYNRNHIKNYGEKDENNIYKYTNEGSVISKNGFSVVHVPTEDSKFYSIEDLYTIVHEISHLFDLASNDTVPDMKRATENDERCYKRNNARYLLAETTAIAFEGILTDYLIHNNTYSGSEIKQNAIRRIRGSYYTAETIYAQLLLAEGKEKNGKITQAWIKEVAKGNNLSPQYVKNLINRILAVQKDFQYITKYAIAGLLSPTIVERYKKDKDGTIILIKNYLQCIKNDDIQGALETFDIEFDEDGIMRLSQNARIQEDSFREEER